MTNTLKPEVGGRKTDEGFTEAELRRRDLVENAIFELIRQINPSGKEVERDIGTIIAVREAVQYGLVDKQRITDAQSFYPYLKDEAEIAHVLPSLPEGTLLGLQPHHTKEFAVVLTVHRDDLVQAGLPKGLAEKVDDDTLMKIGEELGSSLTELGGYWDCLESILDCRGYGEDDMVERLVEDGWVEYEIYSRGDGETNIHRRYLFHPDVGFYEEKPFFYSAVSYVGSRQPSCRFDEWLSGIDKALYIELETSQEEEDEDDV